MPCDDHFGLFKDDRESDGPLWRAFFEDLGEAKLQAQKYADDEGSEFFIYNFKNYSEIARMFPTRRTLKAIRDAKSE